MAFKPSDWKTTGLKIVRIQNLNNPEATYNYFEGEIRDRFIIDRGDLLFAWSGTPGTSFGAHIWKGELAVLNQHIFRVDFDDRMLDKEFFRLAINLKLAELIGKAHGGAGLQHVTKGRFEETVIEVAPLREQRRIVAKIEELFSELDASAESLTRARALLKTYRQSLLKAAFEGKLTADWRAQNSGCSLTLDDRRGLLKQARESWYRAEEKAASQRRTEWEKAGRKGPPPSSPERERQAGPISTEELRDLPSSPTGWFYARLSDVAYIGSGMAVSKGRALFDPVETPYLRVANVQRGYLDLSQIRTMAVERSQIASLSLRKFDVLFNEGGDRDKLGRGWVWDDSISPCITQNHVFRASLFRPTEYGAKLLSHWGNSAGQKYFERGGKQTTNLASVNKTVLGAFPVPVIPEVEAAFLFARLEAALSTVGTQIAEIDTTLAKISALRQSILKRAFSGRLVPQDPSDEPAAALLARLRAEAPAPKPRRKQPA